MATPIGHALAGYAVYKAFEPYGVRNHALLAVFMAISPDLDFVPGLLSGAPALYHQGITHSVGFAFASSAAIAIIYGRKHQNWLPLFSLCFIAYLSHLLIDFLGPDGRPPYGQPVFWPMSDAYFLSSVQIFWGAHHAGSTGSSTWQWANGVLTTYNIGAAMVEIVLIGPLVLIGQRCAKRV